MSWQIARDEQGAPTRLLWATPRRTEPIFYATCPRCGSKRLVALKCFDCWWQA